MNTKEAMVESHYSEDYFNSYQKKMGAFGGLVNMFMFERYINPTDTIVDFGCGGGFLLKNLQAEKKIGVEINPVAREFCNKINGIECFSSLDYIADNSVDVVLSCHCLEHTTQPYHLVADMYDKLRPGGKIVLVVPHDSYRFSWKPNDINNHLYSFSPMNLGNILQGVGFRDIEVKPVLHRWPPYYEKLYRTFGLPVFHQLSVIYGKLFSKRCVQIRAVGTKPPFSR